MKRTRRFFMAGLPAAAVLAHARIAGAAPKLGPARPSSRKPAVRPRTAKVTKIDRNTARLAKTHVIRPAHTRGVVTDTGVSAKLRRVKLGRPLREIDKAPRLDIDAFGPALHAKLANSVQGYAWQLRRGGTVVHNGLWQWGRTPTNGGQGWTMDTRMHIASVSKLFTAMAMVHKLRGANRNLTDRIYDYLPDYWTLGAKVKDITFRQLLNHTTGFRVPGSATDFATMKSKVAQGVASTHGKYGYENVNFALCRVLIPVLHGWINESDTHGTSTDHIWDVRSTIRFREYCNRYIFGPSGVPDVGFKPAAGDALAYNPAGGSGWDSGDLTTVSGGAGFRMSVSEVLDVMGTFRRSGTIVPTSEVSDFLNKNLGIDQRITTPAGRLYNKNGAWGPGDGRLEQSVAVFLPEDMELCLFVNSKIVTSGTEVSLRQTVTDTYVANLR
ncbi:MAG: serine hydrolase domain-containing protein [Nannocystales bacterium]